MEDFIGQSLGRYHILEQLGEGGMATVYKAYDTRLERDVAVKIIRRKAFPEEQLERILKRFEREAKALARLMHPNIVQVHDYGEHEGSPYLVMQYMPGGTLKGRLGKPIPWQDAIRLLLPVVDALEYAHEQGIIHRDIKPSNILLTGKDLPMLTDFGIAKILDSGETQTLTGTGVGIGTPEYMAPEQGLGQEIDGRADIYSLGIVFYEMVIGKKPYMADTPMAVLLKHVTDPLPRPSQYLPGLPEPVEKVLLKALAKKPEDRYGDMGHFVEVLSNIASATDKLNIERSLAKVDIDKTIDQLTRTQDETNSLLDSDLKDDQATVVQSDDDTFEQGDRKSEKLGLSQEKQGTAIEQDLNSFVQCIKCGKENMKSNWFCGYCGNRLLDTQSLRSSGMQNDRSVSLKISHKILKSLGMPKLHSGGIPFASMFMGLLEPDSAEKTHSLENTLEINQPNSDSAINSLSPFRVSSKPSDDRSFRTCKICRSENPSSNWYCAKCGNHLSD